MFTSSEAENKLLLLKKNLWRRFSSEKDEDERINIIKVFQSNPIHFDSLYAESYKIQLWTENKTNFWSNSSIRNGNGFKEKMEIE